ncbi:hypothetical protein CDD82_943 [Ophiocordyceps australis]|uniref:Prefoldin subunit 4 n=1 Tax=Ophiocordyceps australis TaxID=1399860 RepID=A0A2C5ZNG8_9HYPO|nr:hypothetical protein CDD82_943 [Ophiocordyceps australis]
MQRRMLSKEEEAGAEEVEVRRQDQDKINRFSRLHQRQLAMSEELKLKNKEKEELDDLSTELELVDEEEQVRYRIGDAFFHVPLEQAQAMLEAVSKKIDGETWELEQGMSSLRDEMSQLKVELYARFGKQINLET